ncbi:hypothetical protein ACR6HW_12330 [Fusibacter sp. JL298sf-3]
MAITLRYENTEYFEIKTLSVIGSFNDYDPGRGRMTLEGNEWVYTFEVGPGEHLYRFWVNDAYELVDPEAGLFSVDDADKLWSLVLIDEQNQRLYNSEDSSVHVEQYFMYNKITNEALNGSKKIFNLMFDQEVCVKFEFTDIVGLHNATIVWFSPFGDVLQVDEHPIFLEDETVSEFHLWSALPIAEIGGQYAQKGWRVNLFINGSFVLEDMFDVHRSSGYSSLGKFK